MHGLPGAAASRSRVALSSRRFPLRAPGTRDALLGVYTAPRFACAVPRAELHRLAACGHVPMADDPAAVAEAIAGPTAR